MGRERVRVEVSPVDLVFQIQMVEGDSSHRVAFLFFNQSTIKSTHVTKKT